MVVRTKNAPTMRRNNDKKYPRKDKPIIPKPVFFDSEKDDFTPLGWVVMGFMCLFIITWGGIVAAPLYWLGLISL